TAVRPRRAAVARVQVRRAAVIAVRPARSPASGHADGPRHRAAVISGPGAPGCSVPQASAVGPQ
ncbi:hypothetical protein, partial [Nonomuraea guangzhouensis]|uniref:hypothetical protein n=1 Tax=Nonomuraea guangzhouensis TaxID=1291555 RepID=UPI001C5FEA07